jgi:diguanylate cyclase (GGDEF)-like protein
VADDATDSPGQAPTGVVPGGHRLGRRLSVWHYLVAIALPPCLGVAVLAGAVVRERFSTAADARRIERSMATIQHLDDLRQTVDAEATANAATDTLLGLGFDAAAARQVAAFVAPQPAAQNRKDTDDALARLRSDPEMAAPVAALARELAAARQPPSASAAKGARNARARAWETITDYRRVLDLVAVHQRAVALAVAAGRRGAGSPAALAAAVQLADVTDVVLLASRRLATLYLAYLAPAGVLPETRRSLADVDAVYRRTVDGLEGRLSPELRDRWVAMVSRPEVGDVDVYVGRNIDRLAAGKPASAKPTDLMRTTKAVDRWNSDAGAFLAAAVREGTSAAAADRSAANRRAVLTAAGALAIIALTFGVIFALGGLIRRRLVAVADGARRLSSGQLEPIPVRGPSEAAVAATGLNDAVANLRRVLSTVELLAAGDLESPEVRRPTPGPLGAAVHASVQVLTEAIREREHLQRELEHRATHDALTGLPNRAEAERLLEGALEDARAGEGALAGVGVGGGETGNVGVLFVDLDHFKQVNDAHGHHAGDHILQVAASRMRAQVRPADAVCRLGGDEFVVIMSGVGPDLLTEIGERLVTELSEPIVYRGEELRIGASIGAARGGPDAQNADDLLACADRATYRAKAAGRGRLTLAG